MKKKFISVALFGALMAASTSVVTSCQDYDDDIGSLNTRVTENETSWDSQSTALQEALAAAQSAIETAEQNIAEANKAIEEARKAGDDAAADAAAAQKLAEEASKAAAQAKVDAITRAQELVDSLAKEIPSVDGFLTTADLDGYTTKADFDATLKDLNAKIASIEEGLNDNGLAELVEKVDKNVGDIVALQGSLGALENSLGEWTGEKSIAEAIAELQAAVGNLGEAGEPGGTVDLSGIESSIEQINKTLEQYETQLDALEKFKETAATGEDVDALNTRIDTARATIDKQVGGLLEVTKNMLTESDVTDMLQGYVSTGTLSNLKTTLEEAISKKVDAEYVNTKIGTELATLNTDLTKYIDEQINEVSASVSAVSGNLVTLLTKSLRGLVFYPNLYVDGIEAAEYGYLAYTYYKAETSADAANSDLWDDKGGLLNTPNCHFPEGTAYSPNGSDTYDPIDSVQYHLNPSSAVVPEGSLSFISRDAQVITRHNYQGTPSPKVEGFNVKNGMVTVYMRADGASIDAGNDNGQGNGAGDNGVANIFALQASLQDNNGKDTLITSDYAMLYASQIVPRAIAFNNGNNQAIDCKVKANGDEMFLTAKEAIEDQRPEAKIRILYSDAEGFDLKDILCIHYDRITKTLKATEHAVWQYGEEAHYDLHYKYDLIDYTVDGNNTIDSRYAKITEDGVLTPNGVDAQGNPTQPGDKAAIGKEPLVRVTVLDGLNRVVLFGFIRFEIVDRLYNEEAEAIAKDRTVTDCEPDDIKYVWSEISERVLTKMQMGNEEFNAIYTLDFDSRSGIVNQYRVQNENDDEFRDGKAYAQIAPADRVGMLTAQIESGSTQVSALHWSLDPCQQQEIFESENKSETIYIRFKKIDGKETDVALYLPLTLNYTRDTQMASLDWKKKDEVWAWGQKHEAGMNVYEPTDGGNTLNYTQDFNTIFFGDKVNLPSGYAESNKIYFFLDAKAGKFNLVTKNGNYLTHHCTKSHTDYNGNVLEFGDVVDGEFKVYDANQINYPIVLSAGNVASVYANDKVYLDSPTENNLVATIDQQTGVITYAHTDAAKTVLNEYSTLDYSEPAAFLRVGVAVKGDCTMKPLNNNVFNDYILRPINLQGLDGAAFTDATDNGAKVAVADLFTFTDWRHQSFTGTNVWYYAYYGIQKVQVLCDNDKVTTDMSGSTLGKTTLAMAAPGTSLNWYETNSYPDAPQVEDGVLTFTPAQNSAGYDQDALYQQIKDQLGELVYNNNRTPIMKEFTLRIPMVITYDWGTIENCFVDVKVKPVSEL